MVGFLGGYVGGRVWLPSEFLEHNLFAVLDDCFLYRPCWVFCIVNEWNDMVEDSVKL